MAKPRVPCTVEIPFPTNGLYMITSSLGTPSSKKLDPSETSSTFYLKPLVPLSTWKSHQIFFFNTDVITKRNVSRILRFTISTLPSKYLGATLFDSTFKNSYWKELLDKLESQISSWTFRSLNLPWCLNLLK